MSRSRSDREKEPQMGNLLFQHNRKAYEAAVSMLEDTGRAAIIHPTGTGKSFVAFQLCADWAGCRICWLSPSEYIFATQKEKWKAAGGGELKNLQFFTYARLMRMEEAELEKIAPDYIILDEFHRCGAAYWGGGVKRLRERYPDAKVLGLSATNIRYLDNQRDMAWELFGGNVASELTLGAAIMQGILPAPKYVLSVYSYQMELKRYELRVRQARNKAVRDKARQELEALRRTLEKADGLAEVFARHMAAEPVTEGNPVDAGGGKSAMPQEEMPGQPGGCGRYIVFCAGYEHLLRMKELAAEWFAKVDPAPHIYTAYSDDPETSAEFAAFKADTSPHLKLLYCIDMLNEGIHVDGLSGVILLRPTVSPIIYKQQIGRALAAGGKETPVIFDVVMNIENLHSIGAVEEELREAVFAFRANGRGEEIVTEHFRIIDEVADCRRLFAQLNETLAAPWDAMFAMAKEYYAEHKNLEVPAAYATEDGYSLGAWVATQRKIYTGKTAGRLSAEQIRKLEGIGMRWQGAQASAWEKNFAEAESYFKEHGDLKVPADFVTGNGCKLGRWLRRQRELYQKMLDSENVDGNKKPRGSNQFPAAPKRQSLHSEHIKRLEEIGMVWQTTDSWERRFALAKEYYEEHGNLRMPADYVVEGIWLDRWLREQKARWEAEAENEAEAKNVENGNKPQTESGNRQGENMPQEAQTPCKASEGDLHGAQAGQTSRRRLTQEQKEKLSSIGLVPGVSQAEQSWREQYGEAEEFFREHGNLSVPKRYMAGNGKNLGAWLQHQRAGRKNGRLSTWQVGMLDEIGMVWEARDAWEQGIAHAQEYRRENGDLEVPNAYTSPDGYRLGKWISNQRCAYAGITKKPLTPEQVRQLEEIGMVWNVGQGRRAKRNV